MNLPLRIAGALLFLAATPSAYSEETSPVQAPRIDPRLQEEQLRRFVMDASQLRLKTTQVRPVGHLSPEERLKLRQDVNSVGRNYYQRAGHVHR